MLPLFEYVSFVHFIVPAIEKSEVSFFELYSQFLTT